MVIAVINKELNLLKDWVEQTEIHCSDNIVLNLVTGINYLINFKKYSFWL